jgi:Uma2 family endonuclease
MNMPLAIKKDKKFTYQDYLTWPDEERWELINGEAYCMSPAPKVKHQRILNKLTYEFTQQLKRCQHFIAPTDVVLDDFNVVQPDLFVVCSKKKITEDNIRGAPDLVIEVTSPNTELKDRREKKALYERFGVKEYIIVFPEREYLERYVLRNKKYSAPEIFNWDEVFKLKTFRIEFNLWEVFEKELPEDDKES